MTDVEVAKKGWQEKADDIIGELVEAHKILDELIGEGPVDPQVEAKAEEIACQSNALSEKLDNLYRHSQLCRERLHQLRDRF